MRRKVWRTSQNMTHWFLLQRSISRWNTICENRFYFFKKGVSKVDGYVVTTFRIVFFFHFYFKTIQNQFKLQFWLKLIDSEDIQLLGQTFDNLFGFW